MTGRVDLTIDVVCTGNICRSPMGTVILRQKLDDAGLTHIAVTSSGIADYHVGNRADERALLELSDAGYDGSAHRARQVDQDTLDADLIIAMDTRHRSELLELGADPDKIHLLRDFDPASGPEESVADPYYGGAEEFTRAREQIEAAADGIVEWSRDRLQNTPTRVAHLTTVVLEKSAITQSHVFSQQVRNHSNLRITDRSFSVLGGNAIAQTHS